MQQNGTINFFNKLREDIDINHQDASSKLRDATKRWNNIKQQSNPHPVIEYREETTTDALFGGSSNIMSTPRDGGVGRGGGLGAAGQKALSVPGNAVLGVFDKVAEVGNKGASKIASGFDKMGNNIKSVGEKAKNVFSMGDNDNSPTNKSQTTRPPQPSNTQIQPQRSNTANNANRKPPPPSNNFFD